jgi:cyclopropane-fatty-acyl-phospholipid synthase
MLPVSDVPVASVAERPSLLKRLVLSRVRGLTSGELVIADRHGVAVLGTPSPDGLRVQIVVHRDRLWRRVVFRGLVGAIDAYVDGDWEVDNLTDLARLFSRNIGESDRLDSGLGRFVQPVERLRHWLARNSRTGSRRNIAAHYDLSNEFFELMLDPTMSYSSGVFERPDSTLTDASVAKIDRLCQKLALSPRDHLLEIGSGWGGFAVHAATRYGCRVTTTTISQAQHEYAVRRIADAGLSNRITVLRSDYRELTGTFDKLVSVEMIEAVGAEYFPTFFETCAALIKPDGLMAIQAITVADQRFEAARRATDFIKRDIFPGSCIPSVAALLAAASPGTDLRLVDLEDFTPHYARTMAEWRANLEARRERVDAITTERFRRRWMFYLAYCEGGFRERHTGLVQMVMARPAWRGEIRRHRPVREATWTAA